MTKQTFSIVSLAVAASILAACSGAEPYFTSKRETWRAPDEIACLRSGIASAPYIHPRRSALGGPRPCGAIRPLRVAATAAGQVALEPAATLRCPMVPAIDRWTREVVRPAARRHFGRDVVALKVIASYSCRPRNNRRGAKLSEHGYANAIDIAKFKLSDGREVSVLKGWRGGRAERAFLREVHAGACRTFSTVIGPNGDSHHQNHFHLDLARHNRRGTYRYCK